MTYVVNVINQGQSWYLRGTTWTGEAERAAKFPTWEAALAGLQKAKPFMKPGLFKLAAIQPVEPTSIEGRREPSGYTAEQVTDALAEVIDPTPRDENGNALGQFAVTFRVSNTSHWQVFGLFPTLAEAREARKQAIASGFRAPATATTQGKVLCWNIEERG